MSNVISIVDKIQKQNKQAKHNPEEELFWEEIELMVDQLILWFQYGAEDGLDSGRYPEAIKLLVGLSSICKERTGN